MGNSNAIRMGRAFVEIFGDDNPLTRTLKLGEGKLKKFGEKISSIGGKLAAIGGAALGAGGIAALFEKLQGSAESGAALAKLSGQTGVSVEALGELGHAAKEVGVDIETVTGSIGKMQKFLVGAAQGSQESKFAMSQLGLSVAQLGRLSPDRQFELIGERLAKIHDPAIRASVAMAVFGKSGAEALPIFAKGAGWLARMRQEAIDLGRKTTEEAEASREFNSSLDKLYGSIGRVTSSLAGALAPLVKRLADEAGRMATVTANWIKKNRELITTVALVAGGALAAGVAIIALGTAIGFVGTALGAIGTVIAATFAAASVAIGLLFSPLGAVLAGMAAGAAIALYLADRFGVLDQAIANVKGAFASLAADAAKAWGGIKNAIAAGDLGLAMKIVGATLTLEWTKALALLSGAWIVFKFSAIGVALEMGAGIVDAFIEAFATVQKLWNDVEGALLKGAILIAAKLKGIDLDPRNVGMAVNLRTALKNSNVDSETEGRKAIAGTMHAGLKGALAGNRAAALDAEGDGGVGKAQQALDDLVAAAARAATREPHPAEKTLPTPDDLSKLAHEQTKGIGSEDVRTKEGFKSVAAALRQGRDDPSKKAATTLGTMLSIQQRQVIYDRKIAERLEGLTVFGF